ncbi:hypothetical protein [Deinococcus yavapaiensis]|uniref:Uncharacterized protein n=1 Tax=Deinococcus yavapaiensis KR-236 TaxID=694435 RepID=A0A318SMY4_9DEIO|nr:hypothetical protein [Deinococcus yavapaiensis]PYE56252.1 hypothetical protein DES52_10156 [Deinococcus yavapaiensis KR-236]
MNVKDSFSPQEWFRVMNGPGRAGLAVIAASPSGLTGLLAETGAISDVIQEMIASHPTTPLLAAMAEAYQHTTSDELKQLQATETAERARNLDETKTQAFEGVRQALWAVSTKATPEDVQAYKTLLLRVAERVAGAAKEGGFLGLGGVQVSDAEKAAIQELRTLVEPSTTP